MKKQDSYKEALQSKIFEIISDAAKELNVESYVIGGFVRDLILERNHKKDIDIVAVGSGIELALKVSERIPHNPKVQVFKNYGTAMLRYEDMDIEFVGARKESYHFESRNPVVENGTLQDDQNRRDFTINAFALPGGQIFITYGLLKKLTTEDQLAGVLGHEVGHVIGRHSAQQMAKDELTSGLLSAAVTVLDSC